MRKTETSMAAHVKINKMLISKDCACMEPGGSAARNSATKSLVGGSSLPFSVAGAADLRHPQLPSLSPQNTSWGPENRSLHNGISRRTITWVSDWCSWFPSTLSLSFRVIGRNAAPPAPASWGCPGWWRKPTHQFTSGTGASQTSLSTRHLPCPTDSQ